MPPADAAANPLHIILRCLIGPSSAPARRAPALFCRTTAGEEAECSGRSPMAAAAAAAFSLAAPADPRYAYTFFGSAIRANVVEVLSAWPDSDTIDAEATSFCCQAIVVVALEPLPVVEPLPVCKPPEVPSRQCVLTAVEATVDDRFPLSVAPLPETERTE